MITVFEQASTTWSRPEPMRMARALSRPKLSTNFVDLLFSFSIFGFCSASLCSIKGSSMREHGINFPMLGFAFINALVFAKVMMLFELFDPGRWFRARPLTESILYETLLLLSFFYVAHVIEKTIEGILRGKSLADSMPALGGGGLVGLLSITAILFIALIPFFGLRNLSLALGEGRLEPTISESALSGRRRAPQRRGVAISIVFRGFSGCETLSLGRLG